MCVCVCVCVCVYGYVCVYIYIYIYIYTKREREREVCLIQHHWLRHIMLDYEICLNIKSDHSNLEACD